MPIPARDTTTPSPATPGSVVSPSRPATPSSVVSPGSPMSPSGVENLLELEHELDVANDSHPTRPNTWTPRTTPTR